MQPKNSYSVTLFSVIFKKKSFVARISVEGFLHQTFFIKLTYATITVDLSVISLGGDRQITTVESTYLCYTQKTASYTRKSCCYYICQKNICKILE